MTPRIRWVASLAGLAAAACVGGAELTHWAASRRYLPTGRCPPAGSEKEAVIVLGYPPKRNGQLHTLQRWRCQIAARSLDPAAPGQMIFSGAARPGRPSEAEIMSGYTHDVLGVPADRMTLETSAHNTWQNVKFAVPLARTADVIRFASDPLHAARARRYLRVQYPELAGRLGPSDDYRFGERWWLKVATVGYEVVRQVALRGVWGRFRGLLPRNRDHK